VYDDLRKAVQKLHDKIQHPLKKEAIGYVLSLFKLQDENPNALRESGPMPTREEEREKKKKAQKSQDKVNAAHKAWETRRSRSAILAEKLLNER